MADWLVNTYVIVFVALGAVVTLTGLVLWILKKVQKL